MDAKAEPADFSPVLNDPDDEAWGDWTGSGLDQVKAELAAAEAEAVAATPAVAANPLHQQYKGQHYPLNKAHPRQINCSLSVEDVQDYMNNLEIAEVPEPTPLNPVDEPVYCYIYEYLLSLRMACAGSGTFTWPAASLNFMQTLAAAVLHLVPGCGVLISNAAYKSDPKRSQVFLKVRGTWPKGFHLFLRFGAPSPKV